MEGSFRSSSSPSTFTLPPSDFPQRSRISVSNLLGFPWNEHPCLNVSEKLNTGKFYAIVHCQTSFCEFVKELGWGGCYANKRLRTRTNSYITHNIYTYRRSISISVYLFQIQNSGIHAEKGECLRWIMTNTSSFPSHDSLTCHKINME